MVFNSKQDEDEFVTWFDETYETRITPAEGCHIVQHYEGKTLVTRVEKVMAFVGIYLIFGLFAVIGAADSVNETKFTPIVCDVECERLL